MGDQLIIAAIAVLCLLLLVVYIRWRWTAGEEARETCECLHRIRSLCRGVEGPPEVQKILGRLADPLDAILLRRRRQDCDMLYNQLGANGQAYLESARCCEQLAKQGGSAGATLQGLAQELRALARSLDRLATS